MNDLTETILSIARSAVPTSELARCNREWERQLAEAEARRLRAGARELRDAAESYERDAEHWERIARGVL